MDSVTQIVLGASVAEAALGKKIGNKAMLWGAIAGTIPDLDVLLNFVTDEMTATVMHRGFSHSLVFCIIMAPFLGWLVPKLYRKKEATFKNWTWMFFLVLVTHPLLDAHTAWGTQLFWPFDYRLAYKNIFVLDPLYTLPFLILVIITMFYKRTNPKRRNFNKWALIISSSYMLLTLISKAVGWSNFKSALDQQQITYTELDTNTTPLNSVLWNAQIETETGFVTGYYSLFDKSPITFFDEIPKNHHLLEPYKDVKEVQQLLEVSQGLYLVKEAENGLHYTDMRFGQFGFEKESPYIWQFSITKTPDGKVEVERLNFASEAISFDEVLSVLLTRIKGI